MFVIFRHCDYDNDYYFNDGYFNDSYFSNSCFNNNLKCDDNRTKRATSKAIKYSTTIQTYI